VISFLNPLYLLLVPLAALPFLLNLIKRRVRVRVQFPSVQLLKIVEERRARRRPKWREILLMAIRAAVILLLVIIVAGPRFTSRGAAPPRALLAVIDNSPSMTYADGGETRLVRAVRYARSLAAGAGPDDRGVILWTGSRMRDVGWLDLRDAATGLTAQPAAEGRIADVVIPAASRWRARGVRGLEAEVAIFTDMQRSAFEGAEAVAATLPPSTRVTVYDVRSEVGPSWNVALAGFNLTPSGDGFYVNVDVRQYGRPRPLSLSTEGGDVVGDVPAAGRAAVRVAVTEGQQYELSCRGGYPFDDTLTLFVPLAREVAFEVDAATPGGRAWRAALAAAGCTPASTAAPPPAIYVLPLTAWRESARGRGLAERGSVVVVVPDDARGGRLDENATLGSFAVAPARVSADGDILPNAASAGSFDIAGVSPLESTSPWRIVAANSSGAAFIATRTIGSGEVVLICAPTLPRYTGLTSSPFFVGFAMDLRLRALAWAEPRFSAARTFATPESDPEALREEEVQRRLPHAVVTRAAPHERGRKSVPLRGPVAAAALALLAVEAVLATRGKLSAGG
jgi:hypothetical protein